MSQQPSSMRLRQMIIGFRISQALYVAAKLGIADLLNDGTKSVEELARASGAHPTALYRVLRLLAAEGVFADVHETHHRRRCRRGRGDRRGRRIGLCSRAKGGSNCEHCQNLRRRDDTAKRYGEAHPPPAQPGPRKPGKEAPVRPPRTPDGRARSLRRHDKARLLPQRQRSGTPQRGRLPLANLRREHRPELRFPRLPAEHLQKLDEKSRRQVKHPQREVPRGRRSRCP